MKPIELTSTLIAAVIGAAAMWLLTASKQDSQNFTSSEALGIGAITGASVQIGVRLLGVS